MKRISREKAQALGLKHYFTGKPCKYGHVSLRQCSNWNCKECIKENKKNDPVRYRKYQKAYYEKNKESIAISSHNRYIKQIAENPNLNKERRAKNYEKTLLIERRYRENNSETRKESARNWVHNHPDKANAQTASRRALKANATPLWLSKEQKVEIAEYYRIAKLKELLTGVKFHVDHICPIKGETCNGLHVPWNLRVIPAKENHRKSNKLLEMA
ncbi:MAG: hypothetical protein KGI27_13330 [Thaumarchaeota archaeon]|nr:hypothetical protein [Nitrososphaerota archaeon]